MAVIDAEDREVGRVQDGDGRERADIHQQFAVSGRDQHPADRGGDVADPGRAVNARFDRYLTRCLTWGFIDGCMAARALVVAAPFIIISALGGTAMAADLANTLHMDVPTGRVVIEMRPDLHVRRILSMARNSERVHGRK